MTEEGKIRILAVEDNPDTQTLLKYLLRPRYDVYLVPHVEEALEAVKADSYDLFLLDINLGEQRTGIDLLHNLRSMNEHRETPALAVTAYAMPGDRDRFLQEGFDAYVSKPFTRSDLLDAIETALPSSTDE